MLKQITLFVVLLASVGVAIGGTIVRRHVAPFKQKWLEVALPDERAIADVTRGQIPPLPPLPATPPLVGTYTGLTGFFDYQLNTGACQYIRVDRNTPSGNFIHVIYMTDPDSAVSGNPNRGTYYAYSTNGGGTWNTFNQMRVPDRRSGYPSLDMLQGSTQGTIIGNHSVPGTGVLSSFIYVDSPPGGGAFSELGPPGEPFGSDERIWPDVTSASDGSISFTASRQTARTCFVTRTVDFVSWASWTAINPTGSAGLPMKSNTTGRVGIIHNTWFGVGDGVYFFESTNNGATWPATGQLLFPAQRIVGPDTMGFTMGSDLVYNGNNALVVVGETNDGINAPTDSAQITFWSQATGYVVAASKVNTPGVAPFENRPMLSTSTLDMPSIGMSGSTIVVAFHALMRNDTSSNGYNCSDIFIVQSNNGGATWSTPRNISVSPGLADRFVSVSPWNEPGKVNLVWQEDTQAGTQVLPDPDATVNRTRQVFAKITLTDVGESETKAASFKLEQNYPNPFNPATVIDYTIGRSGHVSIKVYDLLGKEVATIVSDDLQPGGYQATFDGSRLPSGVYMYQMKAGSYSESKKLLLLK